eukprot:8708039-Pyramimonas_sp.AAC.1
MAMEEVAFLDQLLAMASTPRITARWQCGTTRMASAAGLSRTPLRSWPQLSGVTGPSQGRGPW